MFVLFAGGVFGREEGGRSLNVFPPFVFAGGFAVLLGGLAVLVGGFTGLFPALFVVAGRFVFGCTPLACVGNGLAGGATLTVGRGCVASG